MARTIQRGSGLILTLPDTYEVSEVLPTERAPARRAGRRLPAGPVPMPKVKTTETDENAAVVAALAPQDMELVDTVDLQPTREATPPSGQRRAGAPQVPSEQSLKLEIDLRAGEDAVVLVEQEGVYSWVAAAAREDVAAPSTRRGPGPAAPRKRVRFQFVVHASSPLSARPDRRGFVRDFIYERVRAFVLKYTVPFVTGQVVGHLERHVRKGLVTIDSVDPARWSHIGERSRPALPRNRPARILLLLHGTFSSTAGSFGPLAATPWGRKFLEGAWASYDVVLGYDHPTLSEDPRANALDLLERLRAYAGRTAPHVDVVTYSRGGLVFRSLVEDVLGGCDWLPDFGPVIFVAVPNAGTRMAEHENWDRLVDLYTNLAVATSRVLALMPGAPPFAELFKESVKTLGALVKSLASVAVAEGQVPGLAAMDPAGPFIRALNQEQPGQPKLARTRYFAVTSEFEPRILGGEHEPKELPLRLVQALTAGFVDQLMGEANDLVVHTTSMTAIDPHLPGFIRDRLDFGKTPLVYHTTYFVRPEVVNSMTRWLRLIQPHRAAAAPERERKLGPRPGPRRTRGPTIVPTREGAGEKGSTGPRSAAESVRGGPMVRAEVPAAVETDVLVASSATPVNFLRDEVKELTPSYVVIQRVDPDGQRYQYAYTGEELLAGIQSARGNKTAFEVLSLRETMSSRSLPVGDLTGTAFSVATGDPGAAPATMNRGVVFDGDETVGVLPASTDLPSVADLSEMARRTVSPVGDRDRIVARRMNPTFRRVTAAARGTGRRAVAVPVTCHFHAEIDEQVRVKRVTTIEVAMSRELIERATGRAAAAGAGKVDPGAKILVQAIPKANFENVGDWQKEVNPPVPGSPQTVYFDVRPTHVGGGEIWITASQGQIPLVTLVLKPDIVSALSNARNKAISEGTVEEPPPLEEPLHQLTIIEMQSGAQRYYRYLLQSPDLQILDSYDSKPFKGDRRKYVDNLYRQIEKRWVSTGQDVDAFTAELRAFGGELLDELIPDLFQQTLWKYRKDIQSILVVSTEPFIPWEIVHLKELGKPLPAVPLFFGQMGLVRWLYNRPYPPRDLRIRQGRARYVIPHYPHPDYVLPQAEQEAAFLEKEFRAKAIDPHINAVLEALRLPGPLDLVHFACHGEAEHNNTSNAKLLLEGRVENGNYIPEYLLASLPEQYGNMGGPDGNRPIVTLNACQVGRSGYRLTGTGGFAQAFLKAGAGAFIGTLWSVGDSPARTFTETLYSALRSRSKLAEAVAQAREAARKAGDATWLAYVVYGHPHARLK